MRSENHTIARAIQPPIGTNWTWADRQPIWRLWWSTVGVWKTWRQRVEWWVSLPKSNLTDPPPIYLVISLESLHISRNFVGIPHLCQICAQICGDLVISVQIWWSDLSLDETCTQIWWRLWDLRRRNATSLDRRCFTHFQLKSA